MNTIRNYNAVKRYFFLYLPSIAIAVISLTAQIAWPNQHLQASDFSQSIYLTMLVNQFTHLGWTHLSLNLAGLFLIVWGFEKSLPIHLIWSAQLMSFLAIPAYITWIEPLSWYCGLSGALHFQFAVFLGWSLFHGVKERAVHWPLWILLGGLLVKLGIEFYKGNYNDPVIGGAIAVQAHRGGVLFGLIYLALTLCFLKTLSKAAKPNNP